MFRILWTPPTPGAVHPLIPGTTADGRECYFRGSPQGGSLGHVVYSLPDTPRNRTVVRALPPSFAVEETAEAEPAEGEREALMQRLRELGIPHRRNERLDTLARKLKEAA